MSELFQRLKVALPGAIFNPPASDVQIMRVQRALGTPFPEWLRDLYRCCNGIQGKQFRDPYLYALEAHDDSGDSLLSWNQFLRDELDRNQATYGIAGSGADLDPLHVRHLLIIGGVNGNNWAIDPKGGPQIIDYNVRAPDEREVLAIDLVEMCIKNEQMDQEIHERLFKGRAPLRRGADPLPASNDIELILDTLIELYRGTKRMPMFAREATSPGWSLYRGISQRHGENGMLFVFSRGSSFEIQVATRDGNLPFVLRAKVAFQEEPIRCLVKDLPETLLCFLSAVDLNPWKSPDNASTREAQIAQAGHVWRHRYGPLEDTLEDMADVLFGRDDRRLIEENRLGE